MLTQEQRISISKKIVSAPADKALLDKAISIVQQEIIKAQDLDNANKNILDSITAIINPFQTELGLINGVGRTEVNEAEFLDSAHRLNGNIYFPNTGVAIPSLPTGRWLQMAPFLLNKAIGKNYNESFNTVAINEENSSPPLISAIDNFLVTYTVEIERVTGQQAVPVDNIILYVALRNAVDNIKAQVTIVKSILTNQKNILLTNTDSDQAEIQAAIASIDTALNNINTWEAYPDYNTSHGQTTTVGFYAYNPALLYPTKAQIANLNTLRNAISNRLTFASSTRKNQILVKLGNITQNTSTGEITSSTGLYGKRGNFINLRLNLLNGSLSDYISKQNSISALEKQKSAIDLASNTYSTIITASLLEAVTNGTNFVNIDKDSGFSVGDKVFLVSDTQEEMSAVIQEIQGKRIRLNIEPPPKYRRSENGRLYKEL